MTTNLQSPEHLFITQVSKKGRSTADGVYLNGFTVEVDPHEIYVAVDSDRFDAFSPPPRVDQSDWKDLMIRLRSSGRDSVFTVFSTRGEVYNFSLSGCTLDLVNFVPWVSLRSFSLVVARAQSALKAATEFSGLAAGVIKVTVGQGFVDWDDLVEEGEAELEERDLSY